MLDMDLRKFPSLLEKSASVRMLTMNSVKTVSKSAISVLNRGSDSDMQGLFNTLFPSSQ
jgi:hypothetical protein